MRPEKQTQVIVPSILDRLIDDDPNSGLEAPTPLHLQLAKIKENIRRDLENLLNTRLKISRDLDPYPELDQSIINYGLPDFSHLPIDSENECTSLANRITGIISRFEPRLRNIDVNIRPMGEGINRTLYVEILATLIITPSPISVFFDSRLHHIDRKLTLREAKHGR